MRGVEGQLHERAIEDSNETVQLWQDWFGAKLAEEFCKHRLTPLRRSVAGPARRAVTGGGWYAHLTHLTAWIYDLNPLPTELCNRLSITRGRAAMVMTDYAIANL